ncbi:FMN-dependent NADH-azoreductase [Kibdelosporangium banguiense]|uniref:FMN dependent NADH:quinone oxidoreductase n=1 Tax=Kibdelosporangium banguiense TaxID=1365924 RepID=A0ABS4T659_9PSEU|nr:NAD(P)H-dependent oxidoreductase [Kibdelosporangium banguiense]MBP2319949.1 FMN-dependent NADH-azoreductase [Kibdelosporangium banguiense]
MTNLLHIDSSINGERSHSRPLTAAFAQAWKVANPDGGYTYRDLAVEQIPHLSGEYFAGATMPADLRTPEQTAAYESFKPWRDELVAADVVVLGVPMYNFTLPSSLKAWMDHVIVPEMLVNEETGEGPLAHKKVFVVTARGGSYAPGTPREGWDFQEPLLRANFSKVGLDQDITFIHSEMTLAYVREHLKQFQHIADASKESALKAVQELAAVA